VAAGLAAVLNPALSTPGAFAGTPEFASPEQFAGIEVDIRSDLGVTIWQMLTGHVVFRGSLAEVMYQHQRAPLPREQLSLVERRISLFWMMRGRTSTSISQY
jgi:serine/threonine protein kinase